MNFEELKEIVVNHIFIEGRILTLIQKLELTDEQLKEINLLIIETAQKNYPSEILSLLKALLKL